MDEDSRKYFWLAALVVLALGLAYIALQANRMALDAVKRRHEITPPPAASVTATNPAAARRRAYER